MSSRVLWTAVKSQSSEVKCAGKVQAPTSVGSK